MTQRKLDILVVCTGVIDIYDLQIFDLLFDVDDGNVVLVVIVEVLASHTPDEGVVVGACGSVHRPLGRHDGLLVVQPYVAALLGLTHDVTDGLSVGQVEVVVSLDAATVGVRRHGVPDGTGVELCQTELQLAGAFLEHVVDDELVDGAVVGFLDGSHGSPDGSLQRTLTAVEGNPLRLVVLVGGGRVQVELGRLLGVLRAELHLLVHVLVLADVAAADVEGLLRREGILLAVDDDDAVAGTAVDDAELTVVHEVLLLDGFVDVETQLPEILQRQRRVDGHGTAEDEAVVVGIGEQDGVWRHDLLHDEALTEQLRVVVLHVFRMAGGLELHVLSAHEPVGLLCIDRGKHQSERPGG